MCWAQVPYSGAGKVVGSAAYQLCALGQAAHLCGVSVLTLKQDTITSQSPSPSPPLAGSQRRRLVLLTIPRGQPLH